MPQNSDPLSYKESFLKNNQLFSEVEINNESKPIRELHDFDLLANEIWLLQCPKGTDITELQNVKLKIPGRTNINNSESLSMEFNEGQQRHAFAYSNRKGRYDLRLLPVRGTIVVRDRLKAAETVSAECADKYCVPSKRVPMPAAIRVRHPLLGAQYQDKLELDKSISKRLQEADAISAEVLKEKLVQKCKPLLEGGSKYKNADNFIEINDEDDVEFVSKKILKTKKNKRKLRESNVETHESDTTPNIKTKKTKISKISEDFVAKDLQWLQNI